MVPRRLIVNEKITEFYHITSRCVRRLFLLGKNDLARKQWMEERLRFLGMLFSIDVVGYSFLDYEFHLIIRLDSSRMMTWSNEEVVRRWAKVFTPREEDGGEVSEDKFEAWVALRVANADFVKKARDTLSNLGCFMKCFKQPLSRMANREDGTKGAFFESRYKSIGLLGDETLTASNVFVDLKAAAATVAKTAKVVAAPEELLFTGLHARLEHVKDQGLGELLAAAIGLDVDGRADANAEALNQAEQSHWMFSIHRDGNSANLGMSEQVDLLTYLALVRDVGYQRRYCAEALSPEARARFQRIGLDPAHIVDEVRKIEEAAVNDRWGYMRGPENLLHEAAEKMAALQSQTRKAPPPPA